jgi:cell wall-associated NlpC family hydrolase
LLRTTKKFRKLLIIPSIVSALTLGVMAASVASPNVASADAAVRASSAVVKNLRAKAVARGTAADFAVRVAIYQRGDMYLWGAEGPHRFDCSGLMQYSWKRAGKSIPRTSTQQRLWSRTVSWSNKRPGDMLFYSGHVAMYVGWSHGQNWMIHAPRSGQPVQVVPIRTAGLLKIGRVR